MMIFVTVILAIVQGITEFLPISSSAHLLLVPWLFSWPDPGLTFDAAIHIGTALALLIFFAKEFLVLINSRSKLIKYIVISTIPGATIGFLGDKMIEKYLHDSSYAPLVVGIGMIAFSLVLYYVDKNATKKHTIKEMTFRQSLIVGFAQALALIPGVSRSGITITAGLWTGLKREDAARFSFLLATPISLGAGLYKALDLVKNPQPGLTPLNLVIGIVISLLVGLAVIKWLLNYLARHDMKLFVYYRVLLGLIVIGLWLLWR